MEEVVTTVMFDGQFWIALVEKTDATGMVSVGKHTFGPEPSNPDLLAFMRDAYGEVPVYPGNSFVRVKARKSAGEQERSTGKAKAMYGELHRAALEERKKDAIVRREADKAECFALKQEKKKEKRRGH